MSWRPYLITAAAVLVSGLVLLSSLALASRRHQPVRFHQEIRYDDFAFSLLNVRKANTLTGDSSGQMVEGEFYVVPLEIANRARRINYTFNKPGAILIDDRDNQAHFSEVGQKAFEQRARAVVNLTSRP